MPRWLVLALLCVESPAFLVPMAPDTRAMGLYRAPALRRAARCPSPFAESAARQDAASPGPQQRVVVLGGGLAGLATAYHLLNYTAVGEQGGARRSPLHISIFDRCEVGEGGASGAMAGLLHPLTPRGKKMWLGDEGFESSLRLIQAAVDASQDLILSSSTGRRGILRLVTKGEKQRKDYLKAAESSPHELSFVNFRSISLPAETAARANASPEGVGTAHDVVAEDGTGDSVGGLSALAKDIDAGLLVHQGLALRGTRYTQGLLASCRLLGEVSWQTRHVSSLHDLLPKLQLEADAEQVEVLAVVVACGAACVQLPELKDLPIKPVRAQNIIYEHSGNKAQEAFSALELPVISGRYVVPFDRDGREPGAARYLVAGASQENPTEEEEEVRLFTDAANMSKALELIEDELVALCPCLSADAHTWTPTHARAGVKGVAARSALGAIPLCGRLRIASGGMGPESSTGQMSQGQTAGYNAEMDPGLEGRVWLLAGLGSRGLIHHSILAKALAEAIILGDELRIPEAARRGAQLGGPAPAAETQ